MQKLSDERFWELVDSFERKDITVDDAIREICSSTKHYDIAIADFALLVKRTITKEEKTKIKEYLDSHYGNNRKRVR